MKETEKIPTQANGEIHFALLKDGGHSSWSDEDSSVRLAWKNKSTGKFDPISSSELPLWGLVELVKETAKRDGFSKADASAMIGELTAQIYRTL